MKIKMPGDKSISHRALIFGAIAKGTTEITGLLESADVQSTERCLKQLGAVIERDGDKVWVSRNEKIKNTINLDCGNSGTTMRLLMGLLAGQSFGANITTRVTGDASLCRRPMKRVADPLRQMGAEITLSQDDFAPLHISGTRLKGIQFDLPIASAQVKTSLLLAGLSAEGITTLTGKIHSRDHTERLLPYFGAQIEKTKNSISLRGGQMLQANSISVPGDLSSAAFFIAAACLKIGKTKSEPLELQQVSLNPTRMGFVSALKRMGAEIEVAVTSEFPEPVGNLIVSASHGLKGIEIFPEEIPYLIDEIPILAVIATQAEGLTVVRGAHELKAKETNRIETVVSNLRLMGVTIDTYDDGFSIKGPQKLKGCRIESYGDHRIAMAFSIASLIASGSTEIMDRECVAVSFPDFYAALAPVLGSHFEGINDG